MKLYCHLDPQNGSYAHRLLYPFRYCDHDFPDWHFTLSLGDPQELHDCYFLHALSPCRNAPYAAEWMNSGGLFIWSTDDDLPSCPSWNPCKPNEDDIRNWKLTTELADAILVSTPHLAKAVGRPDKTLVARNLMEVDSYRCPRVAPDDGKIRILWAGSRTHAGDIEQLTDPLDSLLQKWGDRIEVTFVGSVPGGLAKKWLWRGVNFVPGVPLGQYPTLLHNLQPHICLAPLVDIPFNLSKSNIRVLESWSLNAAVVGSPVGEYNLIRDEVDGLYADSESQWFDRIDRLISDGDFRTSLAETGYRRARAEWDWANPDCRGEWRSAFLELKRRAETKKANRLKWV